MIAGIGVLAAPGHTPGQMVVTVSSGDKRLSHIGDTVLHHLYLERLDWLPVYDILPGRSRPANSASSTWRLRRTPGY